MNRRLEEALYVILHLDPRPTSRFPTLRSNFVLPEIKVEKSKEVETETNSEMLQKFP